VIVYLNSWISAIRALSTTEIHQLCNCFQRNTNQTLNLVLFGQKSSSLAQQPTTQLNITYIKIH